MTVIKKHLITSSLLNAIQDYESAPETQIPLEKSEGEILTWKEKAYDDLKSMLCREKKEMPKEEQQGIDFEQKVFEFARKEPCLEASEHFQHIVNSVRGMNFQQIRKTKMTGGNIRSAGCRP